MDITALNRSLDAAAAPAPVVPVDRAAETRDMVQAVKAVNASEFFGQDNELLFQRDRQTQRMVIRLVNRKTNEVVSQIPPEYVLRLAADVKTTGE